jgi:glycosyltransferase involved in cell wall biosynthesis
LNVCLFNHNMAWAGGTFVRCLGIGRALALKGHQVTLATTSRNARWTIKRLTHEGVHVIEFPAVLSGWARSGWDPLDTVRRVTAVMRDELGRPDIVHAFDSRPSVILPAIYLAKRSSAPLVMDWADWWGRGGTIESRHAGRLTRVLTRGPETWFEEAFRHRAKRTTVIAGALAERARGLGIPRDSIALIRQGCDTLEIVPVETAEARRRCGLPEGVPLIGFEGSLLDDDRALLVRLFKALKATDQRVELLVIGGRELPDLPGLRRVGFVPRNQLSDYLGACELFVLPLNDTVANRGRWPSKINDYLSSGRPTVATRVGDLELLFSRHKVGLLGSEVDGSFISACIRILGDPVERVRMGANARLLAETELSWARICDGLLRVYQDALETSP